MSVLPNRKLLLRTTLVVPFVLQIVTAVGLTGYLSFINGRKTVDDLSTQLQSETTARVQERLDNFLEASHLINRISADDLQIGTLDLQNVSQLERHFWHQIQQFPSASYIFVGTTEGIFSGAEQVTDGLPNVSYWTSTSPNGVFLTYETDEQGNRQNLLSAVEGYQLFQRPWYKAAKAAGKATWGDIYVWSAPYPNMSLPAVRPVYSADGELEAVFAVDLSLLGIRDFLSQLEISESGEVFILERDGLLVSSSMAGSLFTEADGELKRVKAMQSESPMVQGVSQFLNQSFGDLDAIDRPQHLKFDLDGERQFLQVTPYRDEYGLDWLIAVVIPESDVMQQINASTRNTVLLCLGALGVAIAIGIFTARRITSPLLDISQAADELSQGKLDQHIKPSAITEINVLASSFNQMADQLKASFHTVQQSEARFRSLVVNVPGAIYRGQYDADWTMEYISNAIETISGYPASDFIQNRVRTYRSIIHPEDRDLVERDVSHGVTAKAPYVLYYRVLHRNGDTRWVYEQGQAIFGDDDCPLYLDGVIFDITERKEAEEALKQSEVTNRALVNAIPDKLLRVKRDGTYLSGVTTAHPLKVVPGKTAMQDVLPLEQANQQIRAIERALETHQSQIYEHLTMNNGELISEEVRIAVINDDEVLIMLRDITTRKRAEEALRIAEENYRSIFENALEGIFQSTPEGKYINVNPAFAKIYGYDSPKQMLESIKSIREQLYVNPEKRAEFKQMLETQDTVKGFEYRSYCRDGSIIWTQTDARAVRGERGNVLYYEGMVQDITQRKWREDELRRQLEELQIEIDQNKREEEVATLTKSSYFQEVRKEIENVNLDEFWS
ncbi:MAG: PAS domain S-box protein [Elainellaceae cyanobacterium]